MSKTRRTKPAAGALSAEHSASREAGTPRRRELSPPGRGGWGQGFSHRLEPSSLAMAMAVAADVLAQVAAGRSLVDALGVVDEAALRARAQALASAALRAWGSARAVRQVLAPKPPAPWLAALLDVALAQLMPGTAPALAQPGDALRPAAPIGRPAYTVVDQAVLAAKARAPAAAGFVNAVLRRALREQAALWPAAQASVEGRWNHPVWWVKRLKADWPGQQGDQADGALERAGAVGATWQSILHHAQGHPPMVLRVNPRHHSREAYLALLQAAGMAAQAVDAAVLPSPQAIVLARPCPVEALPGFAQGWVSVQDTAAQWAAPLMLAGLPANARVLDACAAPGGKTAHMLELAPDLSMLALDANKERLERVANTLQRLGLSAELAAAEAAQPAAWWDGEPFDAILLDAPCSGSGISRRHPDARWLRRASDIAALAAQQAALLDGLWPLLKPGGHLVYATCSVFRAEGQAQIDAFLQRTPGHKPVRHPASPGHCNPVADNAPDGFFYARLDKPLTPR